MKIKIYFMLISFSIFTGVTFNLAKYSLGFFSASSAAAWRFGLAAITMLLILALKEKLNREALKQNRWMYIILGIIGIFGFNELFFLGMKFTSPINGSLIMATNPLLTTILARFILKDSISKQKSIGICFSLIGVVLVITTGSWETIRTLSFSIGDIFILLGNLCWALYGVLGKRYVRTGSSLTTTAYTMAVGAICLIIVSMFESNPIPVFEAPYASWGAIAFMAFFTSVLGYLFWNKGISEIGASRTSIFFNFVPVVTMVNSLMLGTPITLIQLIGAIFVIAGVLTASGIQFKYNKNKSGR